MKKLTSIVIALAMVLVFSSCGAPEEVQPEEQIDYEVALVTDAGLLMNGGYSEVAWDTISEFCASQGISHKYYKAVEATEKSYESVIKNSVARGAKLIIADGYSFEKVVFDAQEEYPDVKFILIDAEPTDDDTGKSKIGKNTADIEFASEQAGYLAGYAAVAGGFTKLGFMGDERKSTIIDYGYGFLQGVQKAAEQIDTTVDMNYSYSAYDEDREDILEEAKGWYDEGTEVIFTCGSNVELPVIEAAESAGKNVIASETDKSTMSDRIAASAVKDFRRALESILKQYAEDEFPGGNEISYTVSDEMISLVYNEDVFSDIDKSKYKDIIEALESGDIGIKKSDSSGLSKLNFDNIDIDGEL